MMQFFMRLLGYLTGNTSVRCSTCRNLRAGHCYGKVPIPPEKQPTSRVCGFWQAK